MTDQEKREKVIKGIQDGLDFFVEDRAHSLRFEAWIQAQKDAVALLKAQEPRVMTLDEALNGLVIEYRSGKLQAVGKLVFTEGHEYYGNLWRVWDKMPTDEQREATPWN